MSLLFPVFDFVPDFTAPPTVGFVARQDKLDSSFGTGKVWFPSLQEDAVFSFAFTLTTAAEIRDVKEFFRERCGRAYPFYLPTWRDELPAVSGASGSPLLVVLATDYEADHLTEPDTRPDHYGRQIFIWQPGEALHTSRVIAATEAGGQTTLDLETVLPFTIDPAKAIVGFCYLARFSEDQLDWKHVSDTAAVADIRFRGIRAHILNEQTNPIADNDFYGSLGFVSVTQAPIPVEPDDNRSAYALGPVNLHFSQDALYATRWAVWTHNGIVRIKRKPTGTVSLPDASGTTSALFGTSTVRTSHITLAFDQNGWEVIAYQRTATAIRLRQFFSSVVTTREWDGIDPVLVFNQLLDPNLEDGDSDVVCYYLKPGQNALYARFQRENFLIENLIGALPLRPLALKRTWIVDQIQYLELLDAGFRSAILQTDSYPEPPEPPIDPPAVEVILEIEPDNGAGTAETLEGDYAPAVVYADGLEWEAIPHPPFVDVGTGSAALPAGEYAPTVVYADGLTIYEDHPPFTDRGAGTAALPAGTYAEQVITTEGEEQATGTAALTGWLYELQVITAENNTDRGQGTATIESAIYEPSP